MGKKARFFLSFCTAAGKKSKIFREFVTLGFIPPRENIPVDDKDSQEEAPNAEETNPSSRKTGGGSLVRWR